MASSKHHRTILLLIFVQILSLLNLSATQVLPTAISLSVVINEIAWMGTSTSPNDEWIELYNNTNQGVDLTGWSLISVDGTPVITITTGTIPANGYFLLERTDDTTIPGVTADHIYSGGLDNTGELLLLRDPSITVIDEVDSTLGWFAGHAAAKVPMVRINPLASGNDPANWVDNPRCGDATNSSWVTHSCEISPTITNTTLDYAVYFNTLAPNATSTTTATTSMEVALLQQINSATTSIDAAIYGLNRQSIIDALIAAHARGVTVRIVGDDEAFLVSYPTGYNALLSAGIPIITDTVGSPIQHNKFLIFDGKWTWSGSTNLTDTGFSLNANNSILITSTHLANVYTVEFEEMFSGTFHTAKVDNTTHMLDYNSTLLESYFSPTDLPAHEVWRELADADSTIHFAMFSFTDVMLAERLIEMSNLGIIVQGLMDYQLSLLPASVDEKLITEGISIQTPQFSGKLHHKFVVIDVYGSDPTVVLGSYNWTSRGAYENDENTLIIHDALLAELYYQEWLRLQPGYKDKVFLPIVMKN